MPLRSMNGTLAGEAREEEGRLVEFAAMSLATLVPQARAFKPGGRMPKTAEREAPETAGVRAKQSGSGGVSQGGACVAGASASSERARTKLHLATLIQRARSSWHSRATDMLKIG